jgi:hypothetical protein
MAHRAWAYLVSVVLIGAVLWPLQQRKPTDSFPLSIYPMFAKPRPSEVTIDHVLAIGAGGRERPVPPELVGHSEVLVVDAIVSRMVRRRSSALTLCKAVAERVKADSDHGWVERLEVRSDRYVVRSYFSGSKKPIYSRRHATCRPDGRDVGAP